MAFVEFHGGQFDKTILEAKRTLELDSDYHYAHWTLGRAYLQKGEYEKALDEFSRVKGNTLKKGSIGYAYAVSGDEKRAHHILEELKTVTNRIISRPGKLHLSTPAWKRLTLLLIG